MQAGGTLRCLRGAVGRADQRKQETGMGEAPVSVLHRFGLLTRTLCILLQPKVSTALVPGVREAQTADSILAQERPGTPAAPAAIAVAACEFRLLLLVARKLVGGRLLAGFCDLGGCCH